jgi:hydrophobic/amphiphilic exporter-1 (mainly G- bacteria), HAE1 family
VSYVETATRWRHGTLAFYVLLVLFGAIALTTLPMELQPGGDIPQITITTAYPGAGPAEVEDLITRPLEDVLEEIEAIKEMTSASASGSSTITMEFNWGTDVKAKLVEVINKINQSQSLPEEATEPDIQIAAGAAGSNAVMWLVLTEAKDTGERADPDYYRDLVEEEIIPELRRVEGTSRFIKVGGREKEIEVLVNPDKLAARGLSLTEVTTGLRRNNRDVRGGPLVSGRREYRVSTKSRAKTVDQLGETVLRRNQNGSVLLSDVAEVRVGRRIRESFFEFNNKPAAAIGIIRQNGSNVTELAANLRETLDTLQTRLQARGENIEIQIAYDESEYVGQSVSLVRSNLLLGAVLATIVLLLFLGSFRTVLVCAISIPSTLIAVFILLWAFGQTLNILTLAGLAFAVGMVIDNAIVVVENVFSHLEKGKSPIDAAIIGAQEVTGALVASTLTTVAVFLPLVMVEGEAGRVFRALGITLASSVALSLLGAVTLVPMLSGVFLTRDDAKPNPDAGGLSGFVARGAALFQHLQDAFIGLVERAADWSLQPEKSSRRVLILGGCLSLLLVTYALLPPADYLPQGNRNLIFWLMEPFPGTSLPEAEDLTRQPANFLDSMDMVGNTFLVYGRFRGVGIKLKPEYASGANLEKTMGQLFPVGMSFPGFRFVFPIRIPIFNNPGKEIQVRIVGPNLERLSEFKDQLEGQLRQTPGIVGVRSDFVFGAPELRVRPQREKLAQAGLDPAELATMVEAALGGVFASEFVEGKETLDVVVELQSGHVQTPEALAQLPLALPNGDRVQVQDVAEVIETTGPDSVNHTNVERSITLTVNISPDAPLGSTVETVQNDVINPLNTRMPGGYRTYISGTADQLNSTLSQLGSVFLFSLLITYLLLMALYRSFTYPFIILATVPLGLTGAVICLVVTNFIPGINIALDMITAIGFVILTGVVVNNAILLVDRALQLQREGEEYWTSVRQATRDRLRAILMSASTSVLGMLPLAVVPGEGAELYQGLGVVLVGGLTFATVLTPTVVPALMGLFKDWNLVEAQNENA